MSTRKSVNNQQNQEFDKSTLRDQHRALKQRYPTAILLFRVGDCYEAFDDDALLLHRILGLRLTKRDASDILSSQAGFNVSELDGFLARLIKAGHKVAVCDQLEDPPTFREARAVTDADAPALPVPANHQSTSNVDKSTSGVDYSTSVVDQEGNFRRIDHMSRSYTSSRCPELDFPAAVQTTPPTHSTIDAAHEMIAHEVLWLGKNMTTERLGRLFNPYPSLLPSELVPAATIRQYQHDVLAAAYPPKSAGPTKVLVQGTVDYPPQLRPAGCILPVLYYAGNPRLLDKPAVSIVGTREASGDGLNRTIELTRTLVQHGYTIISGLAAGIDQQAHTTAIAAGGSTIAVIGTPLVETYPTTHTRLQERIAREHLLISQVPFLRYQKNTPKENAQFFRDRDITMSALSLATIITEAGDRSGSLITARAALRQGRKLFIPDACFQDPSLTWPRELEKLGAIRFHDPKEIFLLLPDHAAKGGLADEIAK
jgi:DNA processing protein